MVPHVDDSKPIFLSPNIYLSKKFEYFVKKLGVELTIVLVPLAFQPINFYTYSSPWATVYSLNVVHIIIRRPYESGPFFFTLLAFWSNKISLSLDPKLFSTSINSTIPAEAHLCRLTPSKRKLRMTSSIQINPSSAKYEESGS